MLQREMFALWLFLREEAHFGHAELSSVQRGRFAVRDLASHPFKSQEHSAKSEADQFFFFFFLVGYVEERPW